MNEKNWTRDKSPYLVFECNKCHQFSYVKLTQKTKKCLRCGRVHKVNSIKSGGETILGISKALEVVKKRQGELKGEPDFEVDTSFKIQTQPEVELNSKEQQDQIKQHKKSLNSAENGEDYSHQFKQSLYELGKMYPSFPKYLIELMAENYSIPTSKVAGLIQRMIREEFLLYSKKQNVYFLSK